MEIAEGKSFEVYRRTLKMGTAALGMISFATDLAKSADLVAAKLVPFSNSAHSPSADVGESDHQ